MKYGLMKDSAWIGELEQHCNLEIGYKFLYENIELLKNNEKLIVKDIIC